jgi:hypothetical protein
MLGVTLRLRVHVPENHLVQLPEEVPTGDVEIVVLGATNTTAEARRAAVAIARKRRAMTSTQTGDSTEIVREDRSR